jgi:hypothetical protein
VVECCKAVYASIGPRAFRVTGPARRPLELARTFDAANRAACYTVYLPQPPLSPLMKTRLSVWIGSGMDGIDGLAAGDPVTAEQMRALFGCGLHPLAELRQQPEGPDLTLRDFQNASRLGIPFRSVDNDLIPFSRWPSASRRSTAPSERLDRGSRPGPGADSAGPGVLRR